MADKLFRDAVHDYISIPEEYCKLFIDTQEFQRLRYIEQTSIRVLFPSARHDRFIHSLGTYHLGVLSFKAIKGSYSNIDCLSDNLWTSLQKTFEIACLLHDVAHAPFSHTLEGFYDQTDHPITTLLLELAKNTRIKDPELREDIEAQLSQQRPKEHEIASACMVLSRFYNDIKDSPCNALPELAARMIIGCRYNGTGGDEFKRIANIFISLLNGTGTIDVDKLDYILRDTWASGVSNVRPDVQRLIASMRIHTNHEGKKSLAFHKSGLSIIQQVFDARNHLHRWIFSHHKVVYGNELIRRSFDKLFREASIQSQMDLYGYCTQSTEFILPTDSEVLVEMRKKRSDISPAEEWFTRHHSRIPLWKSYAEFRANVKNKHFSGEPVNKIKIIFEKYLPEIVNGYINSAEKSWILDADASSHSMDPEKVLISIGEESHTYNQIFHGTAGAEYDGHFFYAFVPREVDKSLRHEIIKKVAEKS